MSDASIHAEMELIRGSGGDAVRVRLRPGQALRAERDAAVSMSEHVSVRGTVPGGVLSGLRRSFLGGESLFQQELACVGGGPGGDAVLAAPDPSSALAIVPITPDDGGLCAVAGSFVCCDAGVSVDAGLRCSSILNGIFSQQGMFALTMRGRGKAVIHGVGGLMTHCLGVNEARRVDNGHLVAWTDSCAVNATAGTGDVLGSLTSGEGVMLLVRGPGRVWVQSHKMGRHGSGHQGKVARYRRHGGGGGPVPFFAIGNCVGCLITVGFFIVFFGTFAFFGYLTLFGDGRWEQRGDSGAWSWVPNTDEAGHAGVAGYVGERARHSHGAEF